VIHQTAWQQTDGAKTLARHFTGVRAPTVQRLVVALSALGRWGSRPREGASLFNRG